MKTIGKLSAKRSKSSYATSVLMITLLLFVVGMIGMLFLHFNELSRVAREQVEIRVALTEPGTEIRYIQFQKTLEAQPYVRSAEYVSKAAALDDLRARDEAEYELTKDMLGDLDENNPYPPLIRLKLNAAYVNPDSMAAIINGLRSSHPDMVADIGYDEAQVAGLSAWAKRAVVIMIVISVLLLLAVIGMLDGTIRLSMYSNRFLVKSMQLVGARRSFITRPYVKRSIANGFFGACLAIALVLVCVMWLQSQFEDLRQLENYAMWGVLFAVMIGLGILISWWSTHRAVTKYLKLKLDELY
jgi:cell division transport system permease protein